MMKYRKVRQCQQVDRGRSGAGMTSPGTPLGFLMLLVQDRRARLASAPDRGASAVEWVVISALLIGIALALGLIIKNKVVGKANDLNLDGP
jgi:hypothetical protein